MNSTALRIAPRHPFNHCEPYRMRIHALLACGLLAMQSGCASYNYDVGARNTGQQEVRCTFVGSSKGIAHDPGRLVPGATAGFAGPFKHPYADKWTVTWKTADGQEISKKLDLTDKLPKGFEGRLIFTISAENDLGYVAEKFSRQ